MNRYKLLFSCISLWVSTYMGCKPAPISSPPLGIFLDNGQIAVLSPIADLEIWTQSGEKQTSQDLGQKEKKRLFTKLLPDKRHFLIGNEDGFLLTDGFHPELVTHFPLLPDQSTVVGGTILPSGQVLLVNTSGSVYRFEQGSYIKQTQFQWKNVDTQANLAMFSTTGRRVVTLSPSDSVARVWDSQTGELLTSLSGSSGHLTTITAFTISGDENIIVTGDQSGRIIRWDITSLTAPIVMDVGTQTGPVTSLTLSANATLVASGEESGDVIVWKLFSLKSILSPLQLKYIFWRRFSGHKGPIQLLTFSKTTFELLSSGTDQSIRIWNTQPEQKSIWNLPTLSFEFSSDQVHFMTVSFDEDIGPYIAMWNLADFRMGNSITPAPLFQQLSPKNLFYYSIRLSPDGKRFLAAARSTDIQSQIDVFRTAGHQKIATIKNSNTNAFAIPSEAPFFSNNSRLAIIGQYNSLSNCFDLVFWDVGSLPDFSPDPTKQPNQFSAIRCILPHRVTNLVFSPDQKKLIAISNFDPVAKVIDTSDPQTPFVQGEITQTQQQIILDTGIPKDLPPSFIEFAQFLPQEGSFVITTADKVAQTWKLGDGSMPILQDIWIPTNFEFSTPIHSVQISSDQKYLLIESGTSHIGLYDPLTHQKKIGLIGGENKFLAKAAFSPDGTEIMAMVSADSSGGPSESIQLFQIPSLQEKGRLQF